MFTKKKILAFIMMGILAITAIGCSSQTVAAPDEEGVGTSVEEAGQLVVYSARNERFVQALLDKFSEETGIEVLSLHGANPLQILEEKNNVRADIFISNDLGALGYLHMEGLLQGSNPEGIETIPVDFRADDNAYFAISARSRGFIYNKDLITEEEMPKSIEDLFDANWAEVENGYAITRGGNGGMIGHVSALRYQWGDEKTTDWITAIKENAAGIYEGHGDIRRAVGAGEHAFGLVNNYYFHQQLVEPQNNNVAFIYLDQGEGQMGVVANAAGVGLVKGGPNADNGAIFLEWLLLPENQVAFVGESLEQLINSQYGAVYPAEVESKIINFSDLKVQDMPIKELGNYFEDTKALIEDSGLDLDLK
ncbi:iron(III) transport system substrate-binding protein [Natronincola peptidivorans]|uniref:Iron(III) transport system substrate-binding protein n=1 Tax=Natronincola peptidivorans TaxID=426128 RepID=A0A1I0AMY1_9FIRM|nr:extracellular solute-binding protein [Natronincola peptidivorans]SES95235.1 iron(III) transport system substrate-binding protein [Natronincola peptidivorans]